MLSFICDCCGCYYTEYEIRTSNRLMESGCFKCGSHKYREADPDKRWLFWNGKLVKFLIHRYKLRRLNDARRGQAARSE